MGTFLRACYAALCLIALDCRAATDSFNTAGTVCLDAHGTSGRWLAFNKGSGTDCLARQGTGGLNLLLLNDTRANQVSGYFDMHGDDGTRTDQAVRMDMPLRRTASSQKGCEFVIARGTYTDATHFSGYGAAWCSQAGTDTVRLFRFAANGSANATTTDLVAETTWTWAANDYILLTTLGSTIRVQVVRGVSDQINSSVTDATYSAGRAGVGGITYSGTGASEHDSARLDNFSSYDLPVLPSRTWYVQAGGGSSSNGGTITSPWTLAFALTNSAGADNCANGWVRPGDTIWIRGGTDEIAAQITVTCLGTVTHPIRIAQYPGENVIIDGVNSISTGSHYLFQLAQSQYVTMMSIPAGSFEWTSSSTLYTSPTVNSRTTTDSALSDCPPRRPGGASLGLGSRIIGLYIHDTCAGTSPGGSQARDLLVYGNRYLNIGFVNTLDGGSTYNPEGQAFYIQSNGAWQRYHKNMVIGSWLQSWQGQGSGSSGNMASNFRLKHNIFAQAGVAAGPGLADRNGLVGGNAPALNVVIEGNSIWHNSGLAGASCQHWYNRGVQGLTLRDNRMACAAVTSGTLNSPFTGASAFYRLVSGNVAYGVVDATLSAAFTDDTHATTRPSSGAEFVYYPDYFGGACFIAHFGWAGATSITPDLLAGCGFAAGDAYRIRDGNNHADVLAAGTCANPCAPAVASNKTVGQLWIGPNPKSATNPPLHTNASPDGRRFSVLVVERNETMRNVTLSFSPQNAYPTTSRVVLENGSSKSDSAIDAVPMHIDVTGRPAVSIAALTVGSPAGQTVLYTNRSGVGPTYIPGGVSVTIAGATGSCATLNGAHTTVANSSAHDFFRVPIEATGCTIGSLAAATVLYQAASPAIILSAGPSPLVTGDSVTLTGGTGDWSCFNGAWTITENTFNQFTGPPCTVTATSMSGAVPGAEVNRNPLTYDVRLAAFAPGATAQVTISGHTGKFTAANGVFTATILPHGRFSIPVNGSGWGSAAGQTPTIMTARQLDMPTQTAVCSGGCTVSLPHFVGRMWHRWRYYDAAGKLLAESDKTPVTIN